MVKNSLNKGNRHIIIASAIIILAFILTFLPYVSAESLGTFKNGDCVNLLQTCGNCTYSNITAIIYPNSTNLLSDNIEMSQTGTYYYYDFCNATSNGIYIVTGFGDPDGEIAVWNYDFTITPNGEEASVGKAVFYIGLLFVMLFFLALVVLAFANFDNLLVRVGMIGLGYLLLIAITFIGWNMASDFLTSSPFLVSMLRIFFFVLIVGTFPLLLGGFAYYILMMFKIKEIERLMTKGFSYDDAERRTSRGNK